MADFGICYRGAWHHFWPSFSHPDPGSPPPHTHGYSVWNSVGNRHLLSGAGESPGCPTGLGAAGLQAALNGFHKQYPQTTSIA
jgi:hypothetical protein